MVPLETPASAAGTADGSSAPHNQSEQHSAALPSSPANNTLDHKQPAEVDYCGTLNRVLPSDIRVLGWSPVPLDFNARFSCMQREYKYFFYRDSLDIAAMQVNTLCLFYW